MIADMDQGRFPPPMAPGIQSSQGAFGIGTPIGVDLPVAAPRKEPTFILDPWHSAAYSLGQRQFTDERAQQAAAQASEPSRYLHADDQGDEASSEQPTDSHTTRRSTCEL